MRLSLGGLSAYGWAFPCCRSRGMGRGPIPSPHGPGCAPACTVRVPLPRPAGAPQFPSRPPDGDQPLPAGLARCAPGVVGAAGLARCTPGAVGEEPLDKPRAEGPAVPLWWRHFRRAVSRRDSGAAGAGSRAAGMAALPEKTVNGWVLQFYFHRAIEAYRSGRNRDFRQFRDIMQGARGGAGGGPGREGEAPGPSRTGLHRPDQPFVPQRCSCGPWTESRRWPRCSG